MDKGGRGGSQPMSIILKFYNVIIKSANVDKGGGGGEETLIHKMWIKRHVFFLNPSLSEVDKKSRITGILNNKYF